MVYQFLVVLVLFMSCDTGKLTFVADISNGLKEVSGTEIIPNSKLIWVIEDAGNKNNLYGLNKDGAIIKNIDVSNATNEDWEDLTSDSNGNLYIGDFGNNNEKRDLFTIYKVENPEQLSSNTRAGVINFRLPKDLKSKDFEAFFLWNNYFYIFSKENKSSFLIKVPNQIGEHEAELVTDFNLDGKHHKITAADISNDGKTIVLLNHDKLWKITNFTSDAFFKGTIEELKFDHSSQKEGICFKTNTTVYITDESNGATGSNIYSFNL
ncbi:SdiA-regulated protein [Flavobacteriaceae bacterium MAR_2010_72]|nr:SdiA-regulated protein [Flavobacteriaceae bacterium MAR_2010_72]